MSYFVNPDHDYKEFCVKNAIICKHCNVNQSCPISNFIQSEPSQFSFFICHDCCNAQQKPCICKYYQYLLAQKNKS